MITLLLATLIASGPGGDSICGPDSGTYWDPIHRVCAPYLSPPPDDAIYCYPPECVVPSIPGRPWHNTLQ